MPDKRSVRVLSSASDWVLNSCTFLRYRHRFRCRWFLRADWSAHNYWFAKAAKLPCASSMARVKRSKSMPVNSATSFLVFLVWVSSGGKFAASSVKGRFRASAIASCLRGFFWLAFVARYSDNCHFGGKNHFTQTFAGMAWHEVILLWVISPKRGVAPYKARQMASKMVLLPALSSLWWQKYLHRHTRHDESQFPIRLAMN